MDNIYQKKPPQNVMLGPEPTAIVEEGTIEGFGTWSLDEEGLLCIDGKGDMPDWNMDICCGYPQQP